MIYLTIAAIYVFKFSAVKKPAFCALRRSALSASLGGEAFDSRCGHGIGVLPRPWGGSPRLGRGAFCAWCGSYWMKKRRGDWRYLAASPHNVIVCDTMCVCRFYNHP